jgi:hypothetical protein
MKKTNLQGIDLELPYSYGLLLRFNLIKVRTGAPAVMRTMQRVAKHPSVKKKRCIFTVETILQLMTKRQLATLRKAVSR